MGVHKITFFAICGLVVKLSGGQSGLLDMQLLEWRCEILLSLLATSEARNGDDQSVVGLTLLANR